MPESMPPPLAAVLTTLRNASGKKQKGLALDLGIHGPALSALETGDRRLTRERLEEIVAKLGLGRGAVDLALLCIEVVQSTLQSAEPAPPLGLTARDRKAVNEAAGAIALSAARLTRSRLTQHFLEEQIRQDRQEAGELWEVLKGLSPADRRELIAGAREYQSWALCERLCTESTIAAADSPVRALDLAEMAVETARLIPGDEAWSCHVEGFGWAHVSNAQRVANDLLQGEEAFVRAWSLWTRLSPDQGPSPLAEWRMLDLEASLRRDQRRLDEAIILLDRALACSVELSDDVRGRILLNKGFLLEQMGDFERSTEVLREAMPLVHSKSQPRIYFGLLFNLAVNFSHLDRHEEAEGLLREARELAIHLGNQLDLVRVLWLQGRVAVGLGRDMEGLEALLQVRAEFAARALPFDMALATLDVAQIYLRTGRAEDFMALASQLAPVFRAQGHKEALAALRLFGEAAEKQIVTIELLRKLTTYFKRAQHDPRLQFAA